jgi:hypothetical protein
MPPKFWREMDPDRRTSFIGGLFFLFTFLHLPVVVLYDPILDKAQFILGAGDDSRIYIGAFLEVLFLIANAATAVVFYRILKRESRPLALGYVGVRLFESTIIGVGTACILAVLILRQDIGGPDAANPDSLVTAGRSLVAVRDATFLLGPGFCAAFGNGILLGTLMYKSGLLPKRLALIGIIGGPLAFVAASLTLFDVFEIGSADGGILVLPEIVWELSLSFWLIFKGFNRQAPILNQSAAT